MGIVLIAHLRPLQIRIWKIPTSHWIEPLDKGVSYEDKNHCLIKEYPIPMLSSLYKICLVRFLHVCVQMTAMHLSLCPFQVGFLSGGYSVLTVILYIECRRGQHYSKVIRSEQLYLDLVKRTTFISHWCPGPQGGCSDQLGLQNVSLQRQSIKWIFGDLMDMLCQRLLWVHQELYSFPLRCTV